MKRSVSVLFFTALMSGAAVLKEPGGLQAVHARHFPVQQDHAVGLPCLPGEAKPVEGALPGRANQTVRARTY